MNASMMAWSAGTGYRVLLFGTAANLIATLTKAHNEGRLGEKLKPFTTLRLLIIDKIGCGELIIGTRPPLPLRLFFSQCLTLITASRRLTCVGMFAAALPATSGIRISFSINAINRRTVLYPHFHPSATYVHLQIVKPSIPRSIQSKDTRSVNCK
ncbi:ATP-binding protein [Aromatoleum buckelii]|uniref:ATP-binding protein n=1 Tax=Aromatoleum buckelii TaxID=200254 RepID=UPI001B7D262B|nr:ATP-binding protein [Aromatoleum buckelii]MCK0509686.1 ATP-binding protein [Aromatoleum buckelii]